jgi:uncharacterized delta-60 repeat protein
LEALETRYCPAGGLLDPTFGTGGIVNLASTTDVVAEAVAVQPDGKVVVAGVILTTKGNTRDEIISVQRLNTNGTLDTSFNKTGSVLIGDASHPVAVALQPDGKILIGGAEMMTINKGKTSTSIQETLVARLNTNGTLDTTFGSNGLWLASSPGGAVYDLAVLTDPAHPGTVTGIVGAVWGASFEAIKLTPSGALDSTFGSGGLTVIASLNGQSTSMAVDPRSGEIYLAGTVTLPNGYATGALAALTPTGALDTGFGGGAGYVLAANPTGSNDIEFHDVAIQTISVNGQPVSRLVVAGIVWEDTQNGLVSGYTLDGTLDTSFGAGGSFMLAGVAGGTGPWFSSLAVEADGSIVVGGYQYYNLPNPYSEMLVGHLTANGMADTSFGSDGSGFTVVQDGLNSSVPYQNDVAIDPTNGDILLGGYDGQNSKQAAIVRLTAP